MTLEFKESFIAILKNRVLILSILIIAALYSIAHLQTNRIIKIILWSMSHGLIAMTYVYIMGRYQISLQELIKSTFMLIPRFAGLFIYFFLATIVILVPEWMAANTILGEKFNADIYTNIFLLANVLILTLIFSPFYLYAPIYIILKNCFVYEAIREGYKFLLSNPFKHSIPVLFIITSGIIKIPLTILSIDDFITRFTFQFISWTFFFYSIIIARNIFQLSNVSFVSMKDKIESKVLGGSRGSFFRFIVGKLSSMNYLKKTHNQRMELERVPAVTCLQSMLKISANDYE